MMANPLLANFFQLAYVTSDLNRAVAFLQKDMGIEEFMIINEARMQIHQQDHSTEAILRVALAYVGNVMIEIIQPLSGAVEIYQNAIKNDKFTLKFHHIGILVNGQSENWDSTVSELISKKQQFAVSGEFGTAAKFGYVDQRDTLGHYVEYVHFSEEGLQFISQVPQNAQ
jgi:hypothetical protein